MSNKGKHTSKKPFGARLDSRPQKADNHKIHDMTFEKDDIEIPDDIALPEEREIPLLSNSSCAAKAISNTDNQSSTSLEDSTTEKPEAQKKGRHVKDTHEASNDDLKQQEASALEQKDTISGKHSAEHIKSQAPANNDSTSPESNTEDTAEEESTAVETQTNVENGETSTQGTDEAKGDTNTEASTAKSFDIKEERFFEKHPQAKKKILIASGSFLGAVAAIYFIGVAVFSFFMYPNSHIESVDTSIKTPVPIQEELTSLIDNYSFTVKGQGMDIKLTSHDAGIEVDYEKVTDAALKGQNPWMWPYEIFQTHDNSPYLHDALSIMSLEDTLVAEVDKINASANKPTNAFIQFVPEEAAFKIIPEVPGSILDADRVIEKAYENVMGLEATIVLGEETLLEPTVLSDDKRLLAALEEATALLGINPQLNLNGLNVYTIDASIIGPWVVVGEDFSVALNADLMNAWSEEISKLFNTVGKARTYTRPDGKVINVKGGTYGWKVDTGNLLTLVNEAFSIRNSATIEIPVTQSGTGYDLASGRDWGARYVDIDISEQHARFYDANGSIIWESPIVSGAQGKTDTPTGVYTLNPKATNVTLRGPMKDGKYEWESKVRYWMPFKGNSVGLHDASWQSAFGGSRFKQGFGSHGCVNLPSGKASELYGIIQQGDVVVVHY